VSVSLLDRLVYVRGYELRTGWRILRFVLVGLAASNLGIPVLGMLMPAAWMTWLRPTLECAAVLLATWYATVSLERRGWAFVGLGRDAWQPRQLLLGVLTGAAAIAVPIGGLLAAGVLTVEQAPAGNLLQTLLLSVSILAPAALTEELLMRGYPFSVLRGKWGWPVATGITSVLFGLLHLGNPGVTPLAIANVIAAGVFLAGVRVVTGSLAAAWAAHFAWNWTMSAGFHVAVSGLPFGTPGYRVVDSGPDWLSGGAWGPEGGVVAAVGMIGTFAGLSWVTGRWRRGGPMPAGPAHSLIERSQIAGAPAGHQEHDA
jgi:uncharacterized protein